MVEGEDTIGKFENRVPKAVKVEPGAGSGLDAWESKQGNYISKNLENCK